VQARGGRPAGFHALQHKAPGSACLTVAGTANRAAPTAGERPLDAASPGHGQSCCGVGARRLRVLRVHGLGEQALLRGVRRC
jgi:hypothetical protein